MLSCSSVHLSVHPSVSFGKNFDVGHHDQAFQSDSFIPAMLEGSSGFCCFILLVVTRSAESKPVHLIFLHTFQLIRMTCWCADKATQVETLIQRLIDIYQIKGSKFCFTHCIL